MKRILYLIAIAIACCICVDAQGLGAPFTIRAQDSPTPSVPEWKMAAAFVPNVATDLYVGDISIVSFTLSNESGGAVTCSIRDKTNGRYLIKDMVVPVAGLVSGVRGMEGYMAGGINYSCSAGNAVTLRMRVSL